jgi:hypothetical protein
VECGWEGGDRGVFEEELQDGAAGVRRTLQSAVERVRGFGFLGWRGGERGGMGRSGAQRQ